MHELIAAPYLDHHLLVRPGNPKAARLPASRYDELHTALGASAVPFPPDRVLGGGEICLSAAPHHPPDALRDLDGQTERRESQLQPAVVSLRELRRRHD